MFRALMWKHENQGTIRHSHVGPFMLNLQSVLLVVLLLDKEGLLGNLGMQKLTLYVSAERMNAACSLAFNA